MIVVLPGPSPAAPVGGGHPPAVLDERCRDAGAVVDEVEDGVEAVGVALACGSGEVSLAGEQLADAEVAKVVLVLRQRSSTPATTPGRKSIDDRCRPLTEAVRFRCG
jgi:hypothetical protein